MIAAKVGNERNRKRIKVGKKIEVIARVRKKSMALEAAKRTKNRNGKVAMNQT